MQRVKKIDYDEDDIYSDEEDNYAEEDQGYTAEDRENFTTLTPVVRAELDEAGLQASDREIEEALWHYYWDVGKSVAYLKNTRTPRSQQKQQDAKKEKPKSKFDQAAEKSGSKAGEFDISFADTVQCGELQDSVCSMDFGGGVATIFVIFIDMLTTPTLRPNVRTTNLWPRMVSWCTLDCRTARDGRRSSSSVAPTATEATRRVVETCQTR